MKAVDVVIVSYNSADRLPRCLAPLLGVSGLRVVVVDNASADGSRALIESLPVHDICLPNNRGFAYGCNAGWRAGEAPYVLFLNPDARVGPGAIDALVEVLRSDPRAGAVGPRIVEEDGSLALSQRRFPRARSSFAQALFLHRLFPDARWAGDLIRDPAAYAQPGEPDWISGACILIRRSELERLDGFDERFFLYREDIDLCMRLRQLGFAVRFEPSALVMHEGGASAPAARVIPVLASSRVGYARKHNGRAGAAVERLGVALHALTHAVFGRGSGATRAGHLRALASAARPTAGTRTRVAG